MCYPSTCGKISLPLSIPPPTRSVYLTYISSSPSSYTCENLSSKEMNLCKDVPSSLLTAVGFRKHKGAEAH